MSQALVLFRDRFDPLTKSALEFARAAMLRLGADVVFAPTLEGEAPIGERAAMLELMIRKENTYGFSLDFFEAKGGGRYGLFDTLAHIRLLHPDAKIYYPVSAEDLLALGADNLVRLSTLCTVLYVSGPGDNASDTLLEHCHAKRFTHGKVGDVQASEVRKLHNLDIPLYLRDYVEEKQLYYMARIAKYIGPKRLAHSQSVASLALAIAMRSKVERGEKAYIAGLLHDLAKNVSEQTARRILQKASPEYAGYPAWTLHQFVAPYLIKDEFGIDDPALFDAIAYHATGKAHMTPLGKIIYAADKIEPTRGFDSHDLISACFKNYYVGFLTVLEANRDFLLSKGYRVDNPLTQACFDIYLGEPQS